jgi:hypothetical protein
VSGVLLAIAFLVKANASGQVLALVAPSLVPNQDLSIVETLHSKIDTKSSGVGLGFALPPPAVSECSGGLSQTVRILATTDSGVLQKLTVVYRSKNVGDAAGAENNPLGRLFVVDLKEAEPAISTQDDKPVSASERTFVSNNVRRLAGYFAAARELCALDIGGTTELTPRIISGLLNLQESQIRRASIKAVGEGRDAKFELEIVSVKQGREEVVQKGVLSIAPDWSLLTASLTSGPVREAALDGAKIRVEVGTSLDLSVKMSRK